MQAHQGMRAVPSQKKFGLVVVANRVQLFLIHHVLQGFSASSTHQASCNSMFVFKILDRSMIGINGYPGFPWRLDIYKGRVGSSG